MIYTMIYGEEKYFTLCAEKLFLSVHFAASITRERHRFGGVQLSQALIPLALSRCLNRRRVAPRDFASDSDRAFLAQLQRDLTTFVALLRFPVGRYPGRAMGRSKILSTAEIDYVGPRRYPDEARIRILRTLRHGGTRRRRYRMSVTLHALFVT